MHARVEPIHFLSSPSRYQSFRAAEERTARSSLVASLPRHRRQWRPEFHLVHIAPLLLAGTPAQADFAIAQQVGPALADAVLFLAEPPGALVPVALAQAQFVEDERDERAVVARGPLGVVVASACARGWGLRFGRVRWCGDGFQCVEVLALEAEREGGRTCALALRCGGSGMLDVFLVARGTVIVVAEGAATLEIAARWRAWLRFCDLGFWHCMRLRLFRLRARSRFEYDGAAEVWWCTDDLWTRRQRCGKVASEE